jgi:carboxylesterase
MKGSLFLPTAEPFLFPGGDTGCLLIHGFTGTPKEMRGIGEYLSNQGHTCLGVRLAGHATRIEDMTRMQWQDWLASVEDGYHFLRGMTSRTFIIGLSMGGILALTFAARYPVDGLIIMATPHHLPDDPRRKILRLIAFFQPRQIKGPPEWFDKEAYKDHVSYPADPTISYIQLASLMEEMQASLPKIQIPTLLMYSRQDPTVRATEGHLEGMQKGLSNAPVEVHWIENSGHILPGDAERQAVWQKTAEFIAKVSGA